MDPIAVSSWIGPRPVFSKFNEQKPLVLGSHPLKAKVSPSTPSRSSPKAWTLTAAANFTDHLPRTRHCAKPFAYITSPQQPYPMGYSYSPHFADEEIEVRLANSHPLVNLGIKPRRKHAQSSYLPLPKWQEGGFILRNINGWNVNKNTS